MWPAGGTVTGIPDDLGKSLATFLDAAEPCGSGRHAFCNAGFQSPDNSRECPLSLFISRHALLSFQRTSIILRAEKAKQNVVRGDGTTGQLLKYLVSHLPKLRIPRVCKPYIALQVFKTSRKRSPGVPICKNISVPHFSRPVSSAS